MTRVYTLQDIIGQLNQDSQPFIDTSPDELVNQFAQANETLKVVPTSWSLSDWVPYPWLIANQDGPTGLWLLSDAVGSAVAFDSNPYGPKNMGTVPSGVTFGSAGPIGSSAAAFTSSNTGITTPTNWTIAAGQSWSLEAWIKPTGTSPASIGRIMDLESSPTRNGILFFQTTSSYGVTGAIQVERWVNNVSTSSQISGVLSTVNWTHVVVVYDGAKLYLYINGSVIGSGATDATAWISATATAWMGSSFAGSIYGQAIYPVALTAAQVLNHYNWGIAASATNDFTYSGNILPNPSFESGFAAWDTGYSGAPGEWASSDAHSGGKAAHATTTRTAPGWNALPALPPGTTSVGGQIDLFPVVANATYYGAVWVKQTVGAKATHFKIEWYTAAGAFISGPQIMGGTDGVLPWTYWSGTVVAPATAAYARFDLMTGYWDGVTGSNAQIWWDDAYFGIQPNPALNTRRGWFTYPLPPSRGSNRWGSAIWNNASFLWG